MQEKNTGIACIIGFWGCNSDDSMTKNNTTQISKQDFLLGRFDPQKHPDFVLIDQKYADKEGMMMQAEAYNAFLKMAHAGELDGHSFCILSATRNFFIRNISGKTSGMVSFRSKATSMHVHPFRMKSIVPGRSWNIQPCRLSRHHWGTDIDINALDNDYFEQGEGLAWYRWMTENAGAYGFCQPYTAGRKYGYKEEKWHWTYLPLSKQYTEDIRRTITDDMIDGFAGAEHSHQLEIVDHYILGINEACR